MLEYFLLLVFFLMLFYYSYSKPGFVVVSLFFFYEILGILMDQTQYGISRMLTRYFFVFILFITQIGSVKKKHFLIFNDKIFLGIWIMFFGMLLYSVLIFDGNTGERFEFIKYFILYSLIPMVVTVIIINSNTKINQFTQGIPYLGILTFIIVFLYVDLSQLEIGNRSTISETGIFNSISLSRISAIVFLVAIIEIITHQKKTVNLFYVFSFLISGFVILITSQRGTIIGVVLSLLIYLYYNRKGIKRNFLISVLFLVTTMSVISFLNIESLGLIERFEELEEFRKFERYNDYLTVWDIYKNNFFIAGLGPSGYLFETGRSYPHSIILELVVEYGILGLISAYMIIKNGIKYSLLIIRKSSNNDYKAIACSWIFMLVSVMVSGNIITNSMFWILSTILVVIIFLNKKDTNQMIELNEVR